MLMNDSEFTVFKESLKECEDLAKEFKISLTDVIQLRQLLCLQKQQADQSPIVK